MLELCEACEVWIWLDQTFAPKSRGFGRWSMKIVHLDPRTDQIERPCRFQSSCIIPAIAFFIKTSPRAWWFVFLSFGWHFNRIPPKEVIYINHAKPLFLVGDPFRFRSFLASKPGMLCILWWSSIPGSRFETLHGCKGNGDLSESGGFGSGGLPFSWKELMEQLVCYSTSIIC